MFPGGTYIPHGIRCYRNYEDAAELCLAYNQNPGYYKRTWEVENKGRMQPIREYDLWAIVWVEPVAQIRTNKYGEIGP